MGDGFIESLLVAASTRVADAVDEKYITDVLVILRNDPSFVLPETTINDVLKNINNNKKWVESPKYNDIEFYIKQFLLSKWRLPKNLLPTSYDIHLDVRNVQKGELPYTGEVTMNVDVKEATDEIAFHSKNQNSIKVIVRSSGNSIPILVISRYLIYDQIYITLDRTLNSGTQVQISIKYRTELLTEIDGLYQDFYYDNDGVTVKYLATTQFQAVEARRVFPCLDGKKNLN
jgi:Peptidase M1 N-terminal domain